MTLRPFPSGTAAFPIVPVPVADGFPSLAYTITIPPPWISAYYNGTAWPIQIQGIPPTGGGGAPPPTSGQIWPRRG